MRFKDRLFVFMWTMCSTWAVAEIIRFALAHAKQNTWLMCIVFRAIVRITANDCNALSYMHHRAHEEILYENSFVDLLLLIRRYINTFLCSWCKQYRLLFNISCSYIWIACNISPILFVGLISNYFISIYDYNTIFSSNKIE